VDIVLVPALGGTERKVNQGAMEGYGGRLYTSAFFPNRPPTIFRSISRRNAILDVGVRTRAVDNLWPDRSGIYFFEFRDQGP
jgi:hypothetical protein